LVLPTYADILLENHENIYNVGYAVHREKVNVKEDLQKEKTK
jgi:hypothetical protein